MRTTGPSANEILAFFDRLGDPFAERTELKPNGKLESSGETPHGAHDSGAAQHKPPVADPKPLPGFEREDKGSFQRAEVKPQSADPSSAQSPSQQAAARPRETRDGRDQGATRDNREQATLLAQAQQLGNKLQEGLQKGLSAAFARLAWLGKGAEVAEPDPHVVPHSKEGAPAKDAKGGSAAFGAGRGEGPHAEDPSNFASHTTEGAPSDGREKLKSSQDKADKNVESFREEFRALGAERGEAAKRLEKREGKEAIEIVRGEGVVESAELRELIGVWRPETCAAEEAEQKANALRIEDALGEQMRCRGTRDDGSRCLRKPVLGLPYCREHAAAIYSAQGAGGLDAGFVTIGAGVEPTRGAPEITEPEAVAYQGEEVSGDISRDISEIAAGQPEELAETTIPDQPAYGNVVTD